MHFEEQIIYLGQNHCLGEAEFHLWVASRGISERKEKRLEKK